MPKTSKRLAARLIDVIRSIEADIQFHQAELETLDRELKEARVLFERDGHADDLDEMRSPTIKVMVTEMVVGSGKGWSPSQLREEALARFRVPIRPTSLPPQLALLKRSHVISKHDDRLWYEASR